MRRQAFAVGALFVTILLGWAAALPAAASVAPPNTATADQAPPSAPGVFRAATSGTIVPATAVTVDKPTGTATNDLLLAAISINEVPTVTAPSGWTHLRTETNGSAMRQALYWKVATGSEPASYTWTFSTPVDSAVGAIAAYSGVDTTTPIDVSGGQTNASSSSITAPSITTTVANTLLVGAFGTNRSATVSPPSGMTERAEVDADGQADVTVELADVAKATAGATGTRVASASGSAVNIGQLVALRPSGTIAFRAASTGETAPITTITIAKPAGTTTNDVLVAGITVRGAVEITPPAGWTLIRADANGTALRQRLYVRTAGPSEPASYTFTFDTAISASVGAILAYSGINPTAPVDVHGGQANAQSTTVTAPSITTTSAETILIGYFGTANDVTFSAPAGMTERTDIMVDGSTDVASASTDTSSHSIPGPTGTKVATTSSTGANIGQLVALRPVDSTNPVAAIGTPAANRALAGGVTISGTATDSQSFKDYTLEYGAGITPGSWNAIGTYTSQVPATGTLATWSTGTLSGAHTIRLTVTDWGGNTTQASALVYLDNSRRTDEAYHTRIPFELGGGYGLTVGVATGEATLDRELFIIPSYGPPQALALHYSSQEPSNAGRFGVGWVSNLTQYLTFESGFVVWHAADGGTVPFGNVAGTWTPLAGHFETLSRGATEDTITLKDQTKYVFENSGSGRLKRIENRFGKALSLSWSASSATATDASTRATAIVINSTNNRITSVTDSAGRAWGFAYTGTGANSTLTTITDPAGKTTTLAYDGSHRLTSVTRSRSRVSGSPETITWSVGYTAGKATSVTDPVNASVANTFTYNPSSTVVGLLKTYSPLARPQTTYALDALGRVTTATGPTGLVSSWTYDADSNVLTHGRPVGSGGTATTTSTYDARGNLLTETVPIDGSTTVRTAYSYNATNDLLTMSEADNDASIKLVTKYTYDGSGHLTSVNVNCTTSGTTPPADASTCTGAGTQNSATNLITSHTYTANHQLEDETDPLGRVTRHVYDGHGRETSTIANFVSGQSATNERNVTTTYTYAANQAGNAGLVTSTTDPVANTTTFTYDALGRQLTEELPGDASIPALTRTTSYDELGNVLTESDGWTPLGGGSAVSRTTTHVYDKASRETSVTDPAGVESTTAYDATGNAVTSVDSGVTTTRVFDDLGRITSETVTGTNPANGQTVRTYDDAGNDLTTVEPSGVTTDRTYNHAGWLLSETVDDGGLALTTANTYDKLGRELTTTSPTSVVTTMTYDRAGRSLTTSTAGSTMTSGYDRAGNVTSVTDPDGMVTTTTYDPLNRPIVIVANDVASPSGPTEDVTTTTYYDAAGTTVAVKDPQDVVSRTFPNVRGLAKETFANCTNMGTSPPLDPATCTGGGMPSATTNVRTTVEYDGAGTAVLVVTAVGTGAAATTEVAYDAVGRQIAVKDPMGTITRSFYDATTGRVTKTVVNCTTSGTTIPSAWTTCTGAGTQDGTFNLTTTYAYDDHGNRTSETAPNGRVTTMVYDTADRLIRRIDNDVASPSGPAEDVTTDYYYDAAGRMVAVRAPTANSSTFSVTRTFFDDDGRVTKEIRNCTSSGTTAPANPDTCTGGGTADADTNLVTEYAYDARGNRISMTARDPSAASGTGAGTVTTRYAFDADNRLCRVLERATVDLQTLANPCATAATPASATQNISTRYTYDGAGNLASMMDGEGSTTSYGYDERGQMTSLTNALGKTVVYEFDALGRKISETEYGSPPFVMKISWTHDAAGRIATRTANAATTTYTYDDNGNQLTAASAAGTITTTYDRLNRPLTVSGSGDAGAATSYTYSLTSPSWTDPSGSFSAMLDKFDRQVALTDPIHGTAFTWAYRADGQPSAMSAPNGNTTAYGYDDAGAPVSRTTTGTGGAARATYTWTRNQAGQILSEASTISGDPANGTATFAYDQLGRLTGYTPPSGTTTAYGWEAVPNRASVQVGANPAVTTSYDAANRPTSDSAGGSYSHDVEGRMTARPGQTLVWDALGRLTTVKNAAGTVTLASYTYDALDRLHTVDDGTTVVRFRYVGRTTQVAETVNDGTGSVIRSIANDWTGERLVDWTGTNSNQRFYGTNGHHDVTWTADDTGAVTNRIRYDPWGNASTSGSSLPDFRFQGSWYHAATDLSWVVTRWYAPTLGRFVSQDSLLGKPVSPPSRHLYAYGAGDPAGSWDPDGRATVSRKLIYDETVELPEWYGLVWNASTTYVCAYGFYLRGFGLFQGGVGTFLCETYYAQKQTKSDRARHRVYAVPYYIGKTVNGRDYWPGDNVYTLTSLWQYWVRTVNDTLIYQGSYSITYRANQKLTVPYSIFCRLYNVAKEFSLQRTCLGIWR